MMINSLEGVTYVLLKGLNRYRLKTHTGGRQSDSASQISDHSALKGRRICKDQEYVRSAGTKQGLLDGKAAAIPLRLAENFH